MPDLSPLLQPLDHQPGAQVFRYLCTRCGQAWEDHLIPYMHGDVHVVVKEGVTADLGEAPGKWAEPVAEPRANRDRRLGHSTFISCFVVGIILGLATRPGPEAGATARGNHFALCLLGGAAVGVVLNVLRESRKR